MSQAPFYANVDEQTLMNDCARSAIANVTSYAQATAGWEVKKHKTGTLRNKSFSWKASGYILSHDHVRFHTIACGYIKVTCCYLLLPAATYR